MLGVELVKFHKLTGGCDFSTRIRIDLQVAFDFSTLSVSAGLKLVTPGVLQKTAIENCKKLPSVF